ncbi:MAG: universal stress protein [Desulfobacteraceae bacterium]|nr:universal stress protein [Desulfobacteraceae bacterium]
MKILVGYNGSTASKRALELASTHSKTYDAVLYVMTSMEGGSGEKPDEIQKAQLILEEAKAYLDGQGVTYETSQLARGMAPGKDLIRFAKENDVDHIFLGIEKLSRVGKLLLGSTAQYIILKAPCPVTTVRP